MKKNKICTGFFLILIISIFFSSCIINEDKIESDTIIKFHRYKPRMLDVIEYVKTNYYSANSIKTLNRLQFILSDISYQKGTIFTDKHITKKLKNTIIYDVSFNKISLCLDKFIFDEVRFKLKIKNSNYQYYYVYKFCPINNGNIDGPNFKSVNLSSNWRLQIEKN